MVFPKGRNRPHNADVLLLCVFLWIDAVRCSVWAGDVPGLFCDTEEVPAYGTVFEKSIKMFMYCGVSTLIWGILLADILEMP